MNLIASNTCDKSTIWMQKENTPPHKAQTELHLQCGEWASCQIQQDSLSTFIPHHFFREQQWQYSSSLCLFTALYMHLPAPTGLPQISTLLIFTDGRAHRSFWAGHSSLPCCRASVAFVDTLILQATVQGRFPSSLPTAVQNLIQAVKYLRSSVLPDHSPTMTHRRGLKANLGMSL